MISEANPFFKKNTTGSGLALLAMAPNITYIEAGSKEQQAAQLSSIFGDASILDDLFGGGKKKNE